jgi:hypothetical protein
MFPGNTTRALLIAAMQEQGIRCLVEVDDNYLVLPPPVPGHRRTEWQRKITDRTLRGEDAHSAEAHQRICEFADGVVVSTPKLVEIYSRLNPNVWLCMNCVDPQDWPPVRSGNGALRVGFAGSDSHLVDIREIVPALEWAATRPDVEVVFVGAKPSTFAGPYTHIPWTQDVADYRRNLQIDVGLCPVRPGPWADCKSDLKALEYAMAGALPLVSRTEPYRWWWEQGWPAADSVKGWKKLVKWAVGARDEAAMAAAEARELVLDRRTIRSNIGSWREAVDA